MVFRRDYQKSSDKNSDSDTSSDSAEEDLDYLIDDLLENLSVCPSRPHRMTIKNKNRKERPKHDRSDRTNNSEVAGSSREDPLSYPYQWVQYNPQDELAQLARNRNRSSRAPPVNVVLSSDQFPYSQYVPVESAHGQPTLKRHLPRHLETPKKSCDIRGQDPDNNSETGTGNNSEDEYYRIPEKGSPNASKSEDNGLEQLLKEKKGWKVVHVRGDGACLFRSVSHQVFGDEEKHEIIRKQVVDYMYKNREHFSQYVTEDFDHYLHRKGQPTCFGNHLEIQAVSELYNRPVEIYYNNVVPINVFHAEYSHDVPIRLGYYGRTHYNSIIDPCKPSFGQGLGMPNYQPGLPEKDLVKQAIHESEASELEEAMLRDKLAESESNELEDCIADHVLRESLYEHVKARLDVPTTCDRQIRLSPAPASTSNSAAAPQRVVTIPRSTTTPKAPAQTPPAACSSSSSSSATAVVVVNPAFGAAASSSSSTSPSSSRATGIGGAGSVLVSSAGAATADPGLGDFAVLQYMPPNMLDMSDDDVLALVLEQSRSDYINSLHRNPPSVYQKQVHNEASDSAVVTNTVPASLPPAATDSVQSFFRQQLESPPPGDVPDDRHPSAE